MLLVVQILRGALRLLRPHTLDADVAAHVHKLATDSEGMRRLLQVPAELSRIATDIRTETVTARRSAAGVALFRMTDVTDHVDDWRLLVSSYRADVTRSTAFVRALDNVSADDMIQLASYRLAQSNRLSAASVQTLFDTYRAAFRRGDAAGVVDCELIEALATLSGLADSADDLPTLKALRELIEWGQEERVPSDVPDYEELAADVTRLRERASVINVLAIQPDRDPAAAAAFDRLRPELEVAGAPSDREDLQAVRQAMAAGTGR